MNNDRERLFRGFVVWTVVIGGHVLLLMLVIDSRSTDKRPSASARSPSVLLLLRSEPPRPGSIPTPAPPRFERQRTIVPPEIPELGSEPTTAVDTPPTAPRIDWHLEAERVAEEVAPELLEQLKRKCESAEDPVPPECKKRKYTFKWDPEPSTVGMDGLLPYVLVGKRCAIGLGFFACGIGKLPEPNGDLFEGMRDPDRPRSSVPDIPK
jgi:hypothetical protein